MVKIIKLERQGMGTRVWFAAGEQALRFFQRLQNVTAELSQQLNIGLDDLPTTIGRQVEQLKTTESALKSLQQQQLTLEAQKLAAQSELIGSYRIVTVLFHARPIGELRQLAELLDSQSNMVTALATSDGNSWAMIISSNQETGLSAREVLASVLAKAAGRGGGNTHIAQGGGTGGPEQAQRIIELFRGEIKR